MHDQYSQKKSPICLGLFSVIGLEDILANTIKGTYGDMSDCLLHYYLYKTSQKY